MNLDFVTQNGKKVYVSDEELDLYLVFDRGSTTGLKNQVSLKDLYNNELASTIAATKEEIIRIFNTRRNKIFKFPMFTSQRNQMSRFRNSDEALSRFRNHLYGYNFTTTILTRSTETWAPFHTKSFYKELKEHLTKFKTVYKRAVDSVRSSLSERYYLTYFNLTAACRGNSRLQEKFQKHSPMIYSYIVAYRIRFLTQEEYLRETSVLNAGHTFENEKVKALLNKNARDYRLEQKAAKELVKSRALNLIEDWLNQLKSTFRSRARPLSHFALGMRRLDESNMRRRDKSTG